MNNTDFEQALRESAPRTAQPLDLNAHTERVLSEAQRRPRRGMRIAVATGTTLALLFGGATAVAAAGGLDSIARWAGWTPDVSAELDPGSGGLCVVGFRIENAPDIEFDGDREALLAAARAALSSIDLRSLNTTDTQHTINGWFEGHVDEAGNSEPIRLSEPELHSHALLIQVHEIVRAELESQGFAGLGSTDEAPFGVALAGEPCE